MTWYEMNQQRKLNRKSPKWREGHRKRSRGDFSLLEKTSGEIIVQARDGCFGRLAQFPTAREEYDRWALGTRGAFE